MTAGLGVLAVVLDCFSLALFKQMLNTAAMKNFFLLISFTFGGAAYASENVSLKIHSLSLEADWEYVDTTLMIVDKKKYPPGTVAKSYKNVSKDIYLEFYGCPGFSFESEKCRLVSKLGTYELATKNFVTNYLYPSGSASTANFKINSNEMLILLVKEKTYFGFSHKILFETTKAHFAIRGQTERLVFADEGMVTIEFVKN
jgi:hypothetical protein